jgi:hypothetical protein
MDSSGPAPISSSYGIDDILKLTNPGGSAGGSSFRRVLGGIVGGVGNVLMPGIGGIIGNAIGGQVLGATAFPTLGGETTQFLALQQQIQQESLAFETASTILKERHTMAMDAVRNMKSS